MIKMLRRRIRELGPEPMQPSVLPARLQRAQDMVAEIWARTGAARERHPVWRLVEGLLRMALGRVEPMRVEPVSAASDHSEPMHHDRVP